MTNDTPGCLLANIPQFGQVFDCGKCGNIHLTIGAVSFLLAPEEYMKLVTMIHASASTSKHGWKKRRHFFECRNKHPRAKPHFDADPN